MKSTVLRTDDIQQASESSFDLSSAVPPLLCVSSNNGSSYSSYELGEEEEMFECNGNDDNNNDDDDDNITIPNLICRDGCCCDKSLVSFLSQPTCLTADDEEDSSPLTADEEDSSPLACDFADDNSSAVVQEEEEEDVSFGVFQHQFPLVVYDLEEHGDLEDTDLNASTNSQLFLEQYERIVETFDQRASITA